MGADLIFTSSRQVRILEESALIVNDFSHMYNCNPLCAVMQQQGGRSDGCQRASP
jgi:hypothetical protein